MNETSNKVPADKGEAPKKHGWLSFALDFGPLLLFFLSYKYFGRDGSHITAIIYSTGIFMAAIIAAVITSLAVFKRVSPMLWLSAILIIGFGALTIYFRDETFIQIKPTIIYCAFGALLIGGLFFKKAMLKYVFDAAFPGLTKEGWLKLSRNWGIYFLFLAILNEVLRATVDFDTWLTIKTWGITILSLVFTFANIPMLLKHGFAVEDDDQAEAAQ